MLYVYAISMPKSSQSRLKLSSKLFGYYLIDRWLSIAKVIESPSAPILPARFREWSTCRYRST